MVPLEGILAAAFNDWVEGVTAASICLLEESSVKRRQLKEN